MVTLSHAAFLGLLSSRKHYKFELNLFCFLSSLSLHACKTFTYFCIVMVLRADFTCISVSTPDRRWCYVFKNYVLRGPKGEVAVDSEILGFSWCSRWMIMTLDLQISHLATIYFWVSYSCSLNFRGSISLPRFSLKLQWWIWVPNGHLFILKKYLLWRNSKQSLNSVLFLSSFPFLCLLPFFLPSFFSFLCTFIHIFIECLLWAVFFTSCNES